MPGRPDGEDPRTILVWDLPTRAAHWLLVALVAWAVYDDSGGPAHRYVGYAAVAVVLCRVTWGFIGRGPGRIAAWFPSPRGTLDYLAALLENGKPSRHLSHNPLGAWMALFLWFLVLLLGITGFISRTDAFWGDEWLQELHAMISTVLLWSVAIHVLAAIAMSLAHKENLVVAMLNGRKRRDE
jgi:cytochrome b